jgi:predicted nucleic acid-binding protein
MGARRVSTLTIVDTEILIDAARQYRLSHGLLIPDAMIAATAMTLGLPLISKNQRDFRFIGGLQLLSYPA